MALYTLRNYGSVATHYTAFGAVAVGSVALGMAVIGSPLVLAGAAVLATGISYSRLRAQKKMFENSLVEHPKNAPYAPRLGRTAKELYQASGLKVEDHPIYDFRIDGFKNRQEKDGFFAKMLEKIAVTPNAAAVHLGKPVIMISEPLFRMLDNHEEKAVLAHEFAHAAARHSALGLPKNLIFDASGMICFISGIVGFVGAGLTGVLSAIGAGILGQAFYCLGSGQFKLLSTRNKDLELPDLIRKKRIETGAKHLSELATTATVTYFYPPYLPIYAGIKTLSAASRILSGTFSRSNEYQADRGAVELGASPLALITALRKMEIVQERSLKAAFNGAAIPKKNFLRRAWQAAIATHPPTLKRIARLSLIAEKKDYDPADIEAAAKGPLNVGPEHNMPFKVIDAMVRGL